jgi:hypothetical protein
MHAGAQYPIRFRGIRVGELRKGEGRLHAYTDDTVTTAVMCGPPPRIDLIAPQVE